MLRAAALISTRRFLERRRRAEWGIGSHDISSPFTMLAGHGAFMLLLARAGCRVRSTALRLAFYRHFANAANVTV